MLNKKKILIGLLIIIIIVNIFTAGLFLFNKSSGTDSGLTDYPLDDVWIHLVYSRSLAETGGMYYNAGELEAGTSSLLWVALIALLWKPFLMFRIDPIFIPKFLSIISSFATCIFTFLIIKKITKNNYFGLMGGLLVAVDPFLNFSKVSGMEVHLFTALVLGAVYYFVQRKYTLSGLMVSLSIFARPEGFIVMLVFILSILINTVFDIKKEFLVNQSQSWKHIISNLNNFINRLLILLKKYFLSLMILFFSVISYVSYFYLINGKFLPNTFYAKIMSSFTLFNFSALLSIFAFFIMKLPYFFTFIGLFALVYGLYKLGINKNYFIITLMPIIYVYICSIKLGIWGVEWAYYMSRYFHPIIPFILIFLVYSIFLSYKKSKLFAVVLLISILLFVPLTFVQQSYVYSWNTQNIKEVHVHLGEWVKENTDVNSTIAVFDAGAIKYFGERYTLDLVGLNNQNILFNKGIIKTPDYAIVFDNFLPDFSDISENKTFEYEEVYRAQSEYYTVTPFPYGLMIVYKRVD